MARLAAPEAARANVRNLDPDALVRLQEIGTADILVGIPSFNNERTIAHVVRAAEYGLAKYFPQQRAVILNADGGSADATRRVVSETSVYPSLDTLLVRSPAHPAVHVSGTYLGLPGKGSAFRAIFEAARQLDVKACVVLDSDLRSVSPEWIELLAGPVLLKNFDFVAPHYARHKYDGTITNHVAYPLTRALYGQRVRQPIGGDFGLSGRLAGELPDRDVWTTDVARFGIDIWTSTVALNEGYRVCEANLGAKIHDPKDPLRNLQDMFHQVVGTLFTLMRTYEETWRKVNGSRPVSHFGFKTEIAPVPIEVDPVPLVDHFRQSGTAHEATWALALAREELDAVRIAAGLRPPEFKFPIDLWVRVLYSFAATHVAHPDLDTRKRLVQALVPLYFARTASYIFETQGMSTPEADRIVESQAQRFEEVKAFLLEALDRRRATFATIPAVPEKIPTAEARPAPSS